ncbi:MAG: replication initiator protein [Microvirus sp.]|nr:MAG: replication initiator protein [Microvirus sp.]
MKCTAPITIQNPETGNLTLVCCGRCRGCRLRRKQSWVGRLRLELMQSETARFLTLTYAQNPGELQKEDLQLFLKRYRYHYGSFRYFAVGEYGGRTGRGHWHLIMFNQKPETMGHWKNNQAWAHGYSYDGNVTVNAMAYVAGYCLKKPDPYGYPTQTYQSLKPGIGFKSIYQMGKSAARHGLYEWPTHYLISGKKYPLSSGALVAFQKIYLQYGGVPPAKSTPDQRHLEAVSVLTNWGSRIQSEAAAKQLWHRENTDVWASPSNR